MRVHLRASTVGAIVALLAISAGAEPTPQDRLGAQALFDGALALMKDNRFAEACAKLEDSQKLDPGQGTQFQLGRCYEGAGRVASAWIQYTDVAEASKVAGQPDRERVARAKADALAARLPKLQLDVTPSSQGAEITRDGVLVAKTLFGSAVPVDPGKHVVRATMAGRVPFERTVDAKEGQSIRVEVPALAEETTTPKSAAPAEPERAGGSGRKTLAIVLGGAGVVGLGVGVIVGLSAKSKYDGVGADCAGNHCNQAGIDARDDAMKRGTLGTVVGSIGLAAIAGGAVLWLTAPSGAAVGLAPSPGGVAAMGRF